MKDDFSLRAMLEKLAETPGQVCEIARPVSLDQQLAGIYKKLGGGGTLMRPTKTGPAAVFTNIEGFPGARVAIGLLGSRKRVGLMLDTPPERLGFRFKEALDAPLPPTVLEGGAPPCQEQVFLAGEPGFDIRKLLPAAISTAQDGGAYISLGLCYAQDPETGEGNLAIHRMCLQGEDEMTIGFGGNRHLAVFRDKAQAMGKPLPISVSIGTDPAIAIAACFQPPTTALGFDELAVAGAVRGRPVELARCRAIEALAVANAEYVIEGELYADRKMMEDTGRGTGFAMPEFAGYMGPAKSHPVIKVRAVTCRRDPIFQMCLGPGAEHVNIAGLPAEAGILQMLERALPGKAKNVYSHPAGGGKLMAVIQFEKKDAADEGRQKQAALLAFGACPELKNIILVDEDVDPFDSDDVLWALNTRFKPELDLGTIAGVRCHGTDPTQKPFYDPSLREAGLATKTIYDCTVPYSLKEHFRRAEFLDVDLEEWCASPG